MSDIIEKSFGKKATEERICRVAYTLNNQQPVICTLIGDQPLFYLDEEITFEDGEDFLDESELDLLEKEIKTLKDEITAYDMDVFCYSATDSERYKEFYENAESFSYKAKTSKGESLSSILETLKSSRLAHALLEATKNHGVSIIPSRQVEFAFYDRRSGSITYNPDLIIEDQILVISRELRRHWQHRQGVLINPLTFQPENAILVNRVQEADLIVSTIRIAWELQLAGNRAVWERIENSPMSDLGRSYAREAFSDFRTINNGVASASVFETWFLSERCRSQDKKIVQAMLADYKGYVFEDTSSSKKITAELICGLGSMPYGKNYLSMHAATIMTDPIFAEVRDRSNANFLWFIKFERSFKESERDLQPDADLSTQDVRHVLNGQKQGSDYVNSASAEIVQLFGNQTQDTPAENPREQDRILEKKTRRKRNSSAGATIISFRQRSDEYLGTR